MPNRSDRRPSLPPPHAKPNMVSVNGSDASARATPNSACTAGSTTGTDHMPTLPMAPSTTATLSRHQAKEDSTPTWSVPGLSMSLVRAAPQGASSSFRFGYLSSGPSLPTGRAARNSNPPGRRMPAWLLRIVTWPRGDLSWRRPGVLRFQAARHGDRTASDRTQRRITSMPWGDALMTQMTTGDRAFQLSLSGQRAPVDYERAPAYSGMIAEKDVMVPMRDGVKIAVDIYRPDTT